MDSSDSNQVDRSNIQTVAVTEASKPTDKPTSTPKPTPTKKPSPTVTPVPIVVNTPTPAPTQTVTKSDSKGEFNKATDPADYEASKTTTYILNTSTKKFHKPSCRDVKKMSTKNRSDVTWSRSKVVNSGYSPCGHCNP